MGNFVIGNGFYVHYHGFLKLEKFTADWVIAELLLEILFFVCDSSKFYLKIGFKFFAEMCKVSEFSWKVKLESILDNKLHQRLNFSFFYGQNRRNVWRVV